MNKKILLLAILVLFVVIVSGCTQPNPPPTPTCGDGICESGEVTTCSADCGSVSQPPDINTLDINIDVDGNELEAGNLDEMDGDLDISF